MTDQIVTVVSATVDPSREDELRAAYRTVLETEVPDGLLASGLLRGAGGTWQITTIWRDRGALAAMRAAPGPPASLRVFRQVGAEPAVAEFEVVDGVQRVG